MYYIKVLDIANKKLIINDKTKTWQKVKNIINIFKMQNTNANSIKITLKYQNI